MLKARLFDHRGYINSQVVSATTGEHFNLLGHSLAHMKIQIQKLKYTMIDTEKKDDYTFF